MHTHAWSQPSELHAQWSTPVITCEIHRADEHTTEPHAHLRLYAWVSGPSDPTDRIAIAAGQRTVRFPPPASEIVTVNLIVPTPTGLRLVVEWQTKDGVVRQQAERVIYAVPCGDE